MISISFLKSNYNRLDTILKINETDAELLHVDIMDGIFVPYESNNDIENLYDDLLKSNKLLDIHLMVKDPTRYIELFSSLNPYMITIHKEIDNFNNYLDLIREKNIKCGIAVNPDTSVKEIEKYNPDYVLVMGVIPGLGGQKIIDSTILKADYLNHVNIMCGIDGGVNGETVEKLKKFDIIVSGSYVCMSDDYEERINNLR